MGYKNKTGFYRSLNFRCRKASGLLLVFFLVIAGTVNGEYKSSASSDIEARLLMHIAYLANDAREGRGIGTAGLDSSAAYIERRFSQYGLQPLFGDSYFQDFEMNWGIEILDGCALSLGENSLTVGEDIQPLGFTGVGDITAPALFAGYGISATEFEYDDYENLDAAGKIVIILEGEPAADNPDSRFEGKLETQYAVLRNKAINAKVHGAAGLIVVRGAVSDPETVDELPVLKTNEPYRDVGIPAMFVTNRGFAKLLPDLNLLRAQRSIDLNESPRSMPVGKEPLTLAVRVLRNKIPVKNVGAKLTGDDRIIVIGAHYDHLGYGQEGSTEPGVHEVHNGADDNASGVAVMLETAKRLAEKGTPGPTIWFVSFTGEEVGVVGSSYFVQNPPQPLDNVIFMLNLDMVGRMQDNKLTGLGVNSAKGLKEIAALANSETGLDLTLAGGGYGPSDQTSFYTHGIPVMHLYTAPHFDYHSPRDDTDKINASGVSRVLSYSLSLIEELSSESVELVYQEEAPPEKGQTGGKGNRPSLGTIPDFAQPDSLRGVRIQGVRPGSPAGKAGLQKGDILIKMGDIILDNIYDFVFALDSHKPGDTIVIEYMREEVLFETEATLAEPSKRGGHGK